MNPSFWAGGSQAHTEAIAEQHKQRLTELQTQHDNSNDDAERTQLSQEIQAAIIEHKAKLKIIERKLF